MKALFILLVLVAQLAHAQSSRPNTPYWKLVAEIERTHLKPYEHFDWSQRSLNTLLHNVPIISALESEIRRRKVEYKLGGENPGKSGFTTLLKNGNIYVQVYYSKPLKNIDVALTLGHELVHAVHIDSGLHDDWKSLVRDNKKEYAECVSESGAYTWSGIYAANESTRKWVAQQIAHYQQCMQRLSR